MKPEIDHAKTIFLRAIESQHPDNWEAYLDGACGEDALLRSRVSALLQAHQELGSFRDEAPAIARTIDMPAEPHSAAAPGTMIGPYKLLQQIGEGGMGVVYMAEQAAPVRRKVALKIIKPGMDTREVIARFEAERQALALMDHPNIARVFDVGATEAGRPYFVMELVRGAPITEYCDQNNLPVHKRLELFVTVCHAVQHAHQKGIIHRDIKPSNVLVTLHDGHPVPKVIDFGVAKAIGQQLTDKTLFTRFAQMVGTPLYMSPEQAELTGLDIDTRGDIYSLGVMLYELLTGTTPFDGARMKQVALDEIRRMIREDEPPSPSTRLSSTAGAAQTAVAAHRRVDPRGLSRLVRGDLDLIVMKALDKDRTRRYETANGFAADIGRYLSEEPVEACPPSSIYRFRKFARRNKAAFAIGTATAAALVIAVAGLAVSNSLVRRESDEKELALHEKVLALQEKDEALVQKSQALVEKEEALGRAEEQQKIATENERDAKAHELVARRRFYAAQMILAQQAWEKGNPAGVLELLENQRPKFDQDDLRSFEWYFLWQRCNSRRKSSLLQSELLGLAISPDGSVLACGTMSGVVVIWDLATHRELVRLQEHDRCWAWCVAFSSDGKTLAAGFGNGSVKLWEAGTWREKATFNGAHGSIRSLAISPDGKTLAAGTHTSKGGLVELWNLATGQECSILEGHAEVVLSVAFSPDNRRLASASRWHNVAVKLWDLTSEPPQALREWQGTGPVAFFPDGGTLAAANHSRVQMWDTATGEERGSIQGKADVHSLDISRDGKSVAVGSSDRTSQLWERSTGRISVTGHLRSVKGVAFVPDGKTIAIASGDRISFWDVGLEEPEVTLQGFSSEGCCSVAYSPDGKTLAYSATDGVVKLCDPSTGQERAALNENGGGIGRLGLSRNDNRLAVMGWDGVKVWNISTGQELADFNTGIRGNGCMTLAPDGKTVGLGGAMRTTDFTLWDVDSRQVRAVLKLPTTVCVAMYCPDGNSLVTADKDGKVQFWNAGTFVKEFGFRLPMVVGNWVSALAFAPNGKTLAASSGGRLCALDAESGKLLSTFKGQTVGVTSLAVSPDGKTLISASNDGTMKLWDLFTGQERFSLVGHQGKAVTSVTAAPDGKAIATGGLDGTVKIWQAADDSEALARKTELDPDDPDSPLDLIRVGGELWTSRRFDDAAEVYGKAEARLALLANAFPNEPAYPDNLARIHHDLAHQMQQAGRLDEAEDHFRQAISIWEELGAELPDRPIYREYTAWAYYYLGRLLTAGSHFQKAQDALRRSMAHWEKLVAGFVRVAYYEDRLTDCQFHLAILLAANDRFGEAEKVYRKLLEHVPQSSAGHNNLAWFLATCPEARFRDAARAIASATNAVKLTPGQGTYWNTLGVAQYRAGAYSAAVDALQKSIDLRHGGDAFDFLFLAASHWQLGNKDEARAWYDRGLMWMKENPSQDEELQRLRVEASESLGVKDEIK
jgi:WD40 repeat protein/serine/threonine protein kinase/tetratricopeptide (TPR) repeat protein